MKKRKSKPSTIVLPVLIAGILLVSGVLFFVNINSSHEAVLAQSANGGGNSPKNAPPPIICIQAGGSECQIDENIAQRLKGKDLSNAIFGGAYFAGTPPIDLSNTTFRGAYMSDDNGTRTQFVPQSIDFSNDDFTGANLSNVLGGGLVNFTNVNFTNANLSGSQWSGNATVTGVTWSNTTCPDGTNSNNDGNTCVGHGF